MKILRELDSYNFRDRYISQLMFGLFGDCI
jgi:hypothetical protein